MEHNKVCCILEVDVVLWIPEERSTSWCVSKTPYFTSTKIMLGTCVVRRVYDECGQVYVHIYEKKPSQVGMKVEIDTAMSIHG